MNSSDQQCGETAGPPRRVRMAVVGVGALGRHHARILGELPRVELVAVADPNATAANAVAEKCGVECVADYRLLLDRVDAVSIVVPTVAHRAVASEFLERRIPVLVEKPLAGNLADALQLADLAERNRTLLQVGHVERFNPAAQTLSRSCGPPRYIRAERLSSYSFRSTDIGVVHDLMIHDIDLVLDLVRSPVCRVEAFGVCVMGGNEDCVQARLTFENGCIADLTASRLSPQAARTMQVWSHRGCVTADFTSREVVCYSPSQATLLGTPPVERARQPGADVEQLKQQVFGTFVTVDKPPVPAADALTAELESFVDCVTTGARPVVGAAEAVAAMEVAERVVECVATHQWERDAHGAIGPHARGLTERRKAG